MYSKWQRQTPYWRQQGEPTLSNAGHEGGIAGQFAVYCQFYLQSLGFRSALLYLKTFCKFVCKCTCVQVHVCASAGVHVHVFVRVNVHVLSHLAKT